MSQAKRDENRVTTLIGVSSIDGVTPTNVKVDPSTNRLYVDANINTTDIEIGAVEIKDGTTDTRAVVGADGLEVEVKASALPTGAATSSNQTDGSQVTQIKETVPTNVLNNNASLVISNADSVVASTKTLNKTIGATSYLKTLSMNAAGDVIQVSAWSEI